MNQNSVICHLTYSQAIRVLSSLSSRSEELKRTIEEESRALFRNIRPDAVQHDLLLQLESITDEDCFAQAGRSWSGGYRDVADVAYDLVNGVVEPCLTRIDQMHQLGEHQTEMVYIQGLITALYQFEQLNNAQFIATVSDQLFEYAVMVLSDWRARCEITPEMDQAMLEHLSIVLSRWELE